MHEHGLAAVAAPSHDSLTSPPGSAYAVGGDPDGAMTEVAGLDIGVPQVASSFNRRSLTSYSPTFALYAANSTDR
jgi:hypothetical protein